MKKISLLLLSIVIFALPIVFAAQNTITDVSGNNTPLTFTLVTEQITVNPGFDENVSYRTKVTVTTSADKWNMTEFLFHLPDNSTTQVVTDFVLTNSSGSQKNASVFTAGNYNYVNFTGLSDYFKDYDNNSYFNITFKLDEPIDKTKLSTSHSGRAYTETWNITSSATNLTIVNASLTVTPTYWYTRIGDPTAVTFNGTSKDYTANFTSITVYTDLNLSSNLHEYGSGWGILSITYNGPTVDASSGNKPSAPLAVTPGLDTEARSSLLIYGLVLFVIAIIVVLVIVLKRL